MSSKKTNFVYHKFKHEVCDKIYITTVMFKSNGLYSVLEKCGDRCANLRVRFRRSFYNLEDAIEYQKGILGRLDSGSYIDVESLKYLGRMSSHMDCFVRIVDLSIRKYFDNPLSCDCSMDNLLFEAFCFDNVGVELRFDVGVSYIVEPHYRSEMIYAYDKCGFRGEFFKSRFNKMNSAGICKV